MKKLRIAIMLTLLLGLLVVGSASALEIVSYEDTSSASNHEFGENNDASLICNGNFDLWVDGMPECWDVWADDKSGWETAHLAQTNYGAGGGEDYAMGLFIRNVGGSGPYAAGASNKLDNVTDSGLYWTEVQATMWGEYTDDLDDMLANSVAYYGFGSSSDPASVDTWFELFIHDKADYGEPDAYPCLNGWEQCIQVGRYETQNIEVGEDGVYLHLYAQQKFDTFNIWTVFAFDNVLVTAIDAEAEDFSGWWNVGDTAWDKDAPR